MSTKYSVSPREKWRHAEQNRPRITDHAVDPHNQRTPSWSSSPETAWTNGIDVSDLASYLEDQGGQTPEEVRYYAEDRAGVEWYGVLLLVYDGCVVTCYTHDSLRRLDYGTALQAFLKEIARGEDYI